MFRGGYLHTLLVITAIQFISVTRAESQSGTNVLPSRLTLDEAEDLLINRNLTILAAKYQIEADRATRLIASYKPNPLLTVGADRSMIH